MALSLRPSDSRSWLHRWNTVPVFTCVCPLAWSNFFSVSAFSAADFLFLSCFVGGVSRGGRGGFLWFLSSILYPVWLSFSQCFADRKGSRAARRFGGVTGGRRVGDGRRKGWAKLSQGHSLSDWRILIGWILCRPAAVRESGFFSFLFMSVTCKLYF